ncbi:MAG: GIY-YIG nuclease family protein [Candidatus Hodarchaeales archaeon]
MIGLNQLSKNRGTYILVLEVCDTILIEATRLQWCLNPGFYLYFGSAKGRKSTSLKNRVNRHFIRKKKIFWHINYLTTHRSFILHRAYLNFSQQSTECQNLSNFSKDTVFKIISRFGSSDCKNNCGGHLGYLPDKDIDLKWLDDYFEDWKVKTIQKERQIGNLS